MDDGLWFFVWPENERVNLRHGAGEMRTEVAHLLITPARAVELGAALIRAASDADPELELMPTALASLFSGWPRSV